LIYPSNINALKVIFSSKPELALVLQSLWHLHSGASRIHAKEPDVCPPQHALAANWKPHLD
jgi:hypothetical protein